MTIDAKDMVPSLWDVTQRPSPTNTWPLGSPSLAWSNLYLGPNGANAFDPTTGNIGFNARTAAEIVAGVTPTNYAYPPNDLRRLGAKGDGSTDDTTAVQNACLIGGEWKLWSGAQIRITSTITIVRAVCFYSDSPTSPASSLSSTYPQAFLIHDFSGTFFNLVASASDAIVGSGCEWRNVCLLQKNGNGTGASGIAINAVATSDTQKSPWIRFIDSHIENMTGTNDWTWCAWIDGLANSSVGTEERDCFFRGCRFVSGSNATGSIKLNGAANIWITECEANLTNATLSITGNSTRQSASIWVSNSTWNTIAIDWAVGVEGTGNTSGTVTTTTNSQNVNLGCTTSASPPTIAGTRISVWGIATTGKWTLYTNNNVRYEMGANPVEYSGPIQVGGAATITGALGVNGSSAPAQVTGFGTPVGGAVINNYNITDAGGANSNTNKCVAEILTILKAVGFIAT